MKMTAILLPGLLKLSQMFFISQRANPVPGQLQWRLKQAQYTDILQWGLKIKMAGHNIE